MRNEPCLVIGRGRKWRGTVSVFMDSDELSVQKSTWHRYSAIDVENHYSIRRALIDLEKHIPIKTDRYTSAFIYRKTGYERTLIIAQMF